MKRIRNWVVMNFSGNVGKSTLSRHLLAPRLPGAKVFSIESINLDDSQEEATRGRDFGELLQSLPDYPYAVVDVGASNVEDFTARMQQYEGSHEDFDLFLIPTVSSKKQQADTISILQTLSDLGVPGHKLRVLFNRLEPATNLSKTFHGFFRLHEATPQLFTLHPLVSLQENELYGKLQGTTTTIEDLLTDPTDFSSKIEEAQTKEERFRWVEKRALKRLATGAKKELDAAFQLLLEAA